MTRTEFFGFVLEKKTLEGSLEIMIFVKNVGTFGMILQLPNFPLCFVARLTIRKSLALKKAVRLLQFSPNSTHYLLNLKCEESFVVCTVQYYLAYAFAARLRCRRLMLFRLYNCGTITVISSVSTFAVRLRYQREFRLPHACLRLRVHFWALRGAPRSVRQQALFLALGAPRSATARLG